MTAQEPVNRTTLEMMRHAVSHAGRNYYCAERHTQEWGWWSGLVVLGLAQFGNLINDGCNQYFHVTDAGIEYLRKVGADAMTAPIDPAAPVNIAPLRRLLAEQKASHYALDWKDLTHLLDEIDRLRAEVARLRDALALGVTPAELARSRIVAPTK